MALNEKSGVRLTEEQKRYLQSLCPTIPPSLRERPNAPATVSDAMRLVIERARAHEPGGPACRHPCEAQRCVTLGDGSIEQKCALCRTVTRLYSKKEWRDLHSRWPLSLHEWPDPPPADGPCDGCASAACSEMEGARCDCHCHQNGGGRGQA